jgi:hypothetical protein
MAPSQKPSAPTKPKKLSDFAPSDRKILIFATAKREALPIGAGDIILAALFPGVTYINGTLSRLFGGGSPPPVPPGSLVVTTPASAAGFQFPPGHPVMGSAYVAHPIAQNRYIPAASFHRALFEEKVSELITLLAALGATRVKVVARQGYNSRSGLDIGISTPYGSASAGQKSNTSNTSGAVFEERFAPKGSARVPKKISWFEHEPTWKHIAERRLKYKTTTFHAELRYEDSYGVDRNLKAGLKGFGIEFGSEFAEFQTTVWEFEGEFAELKNDCSIM